jgi:hypothetical protein
MSPKQKPTEEPVWLNFTISPTEKARWKTYAKKKGIPLATIIKMELNKTVDAEFEIPLQNLLEFNPDIIGVMIFQKNNKILYRIGEIESEEDMQHVSEMWKPYAPGRRRILYLEEEMQIIQRNFDRLVLKSSEGQKGSLSIIGYRSQKEMNFLARIKADGNALVAVADLQRTADKMFPSQQYRSEKEFKEKTIFEKSIPDFYQGKAQLESIDLLRRIPLVSEEQTVIEEIQQIIGKAIPFISPFEEGNITKSNPKFETTLVMGFALDGHIVSLRLDKCNLTQIPPCISKLKELQYLSLNNNQISEIPEFLPACESLVSLLLINNQLKELPESIWDVPNLEELVIAGNPLTEIIKIHPEINVPMARLVKLKNFAENNLFDFIAEMNKFSEEYGNYANNSAHHEMVAIMAELLKKIKFEYSETLIHTFIFNQFD